MIILPVCMREAKESDNPFFIELYILELRTGIIRIAACDEDIIFDGNIYTAVPFQRGEIVKSMDSITDSCEVTLGDCSYDLLTYVMSGFDFRGCNATIFRILYPDSLSDSTAAQLVFNGYIDEPSYSGGQFTCKIKTYIPNIDVPNRDYRIHCNSSFGDDECTMNIGEETVSVLGVSGNTITIPNTYITNYWRNGVATVSGESRIISKSSTNNITVNVNFLQDIQGKQITLQRGCDKTATNCKEYGNMMNFSGFPSIPFESQYR